METFNVIYMNEVVGRLEQAVADMWYLEGRFIPASSDAAQTFLQRASSIDLKAVYTDHTRGMLAVIASLDGEGEETTAIIFSLVGDLLLLRLVFDQEAVAWTKANVPEIPPDTRSLSPSFGPMSPKKPLKQSWIQRLFGHGLGR